jgi:uncharacterized protein
MQDCSNLMENFFQDFKELAYDHKDLFEKHISQDISFQNERISELTFTNIYLWRRAYKFRWKEIGKNLLLVANLTPTSVNVFPPIGPNKVELLKELQNNLKNSSIKMQLIRAPEFLVTEISEASLLGEIKEDRNNWDYVYKFDNLIKLPGKNYQNIRKKLNKFTRLDNWSFEFINLENIPECLDLHEEWCNFRACDENEHLAIELNGVKDILEQWTELDLFGGLIKVGKKVVAYCIYEKLTEKTIVCHVEKANLDYEGVYQAIMQVFLKNYAETVNPQDIPEFVNREQDLGEEGLRISKTRYHPIKFIKKFTVDFK